MAPLTFRGFSAVSLGLYGHFFLGPKYSDLVVQLLALGSLALCLILFVITLFLRIRLGTRLKAQIHFSQQEIISGLATPFGIVLQKSNLPPYFHLEVRALFRQSDLDSHIHIIMGKQNAPVARRLFDSVTFPNRGVWQIYGLSATIADSLGFFRFSWKISLNSELEVFPFEPSIKPLPIVAASTRTGDSLERSLDPSGDAFDIRPYSPSDGTRRLLWKIYAKNGNLMVRKPEPATIPDGEVCIFLIASAREDFVAGACASYIRSLKEADVETILATDAAPDIHDGPCSFQLSRKNLLQNVWSNDAGSGNNFAVFLSRLQLRNRLPKQVVVFVPMESQHLPALRQIAERFSVHPVFVVVPNTALQKMKNEQVIGNIKDFFKKSSSPNFPPFSTNPDVLQLEYMSNVSS